MLFDKLKKYWTGDEESYKKALLKYERNAAATVENYKLENNSSNGETALAALSIYHCSGLTPPQWAIDTIRESWEKYETGISDGWWGEPNENQLETFTTFDDALGLKRRNGTRSARAKQKENHLTYWVYEEYKRRVGEGYKAGDNATYNLVGEKFGISGGTVGQYYQKGLDKGFPTISGRPRKGKREKT